MNIEDVIDFGRYDDTLVDTSLIKKISNGRNGLDIELHDRDKARKQLLEQLDEIDSDNKQERMIIVNDFEGDEDD